MKFAKITSTVLLCAVAPFAASGLSLRSSEQGSAATTKATSSKAQIIIHGVIHDFSDNDIAIIGESAIAPYNVAQKGSGHSLNSLELQLQFGVGANAEWPCMHCPPDDDAFINWPCMHCPPDDDSFSFGSEKVLMADLTVGSEWPCMHCPPDDDAVALSTASNHEAFVESFCSRLSHSGSANLANAHHCSFNFVEDPGHKTAGIVISRNADKTAQAFLSVTGLLSDLSAKDIAIIESNAVSVYNEAWSKAGFSIKSAHARGAINMPKQSVAVKQCINCPIEGEKVAWPCMHCPPDDDAALEQSEGNVLLLDVDIGSEWPCMHCPPDDDAVELEAAEIKKKNMNI
jgi:hypothetical protein